MRRRRRPPTYWEHTLRAARADLRAAVAGGHSCIASIRASLCDEYSSEASRHESVWHHALMLAIFRDTIRSTLKLVAAMRETVNEHEREGRRAKEWDRMIRRAQRLAESDVKRRADALVRWP